MAYLTGYFNNAMIKCPIYYNSHMRINCMINYGHRPSVKIVVLSPLRIFIFFSKIINVARIDSIFLLNGGWWDWFYDFFKTSFLSNCLQIENCCLKKNERSLPDLLISLSAI